MSSELVAGVNLLWCLPGQVGGSEEYLTRQLVGLASADPAIRQRLFVVPGYAAAHPELGAAPELVVAPLSSRRRVRRLLTETTWLPGRMNGLDVVHHGGGTVPLRSPKPVVVTIHDLQYLRFPEYFSAVKRRYLTLAVPRAVKAAAVVTVPSEFVKTTIVEAFGTDPDKIVVVPHGFDPPPSPPDEPGPAPVLPPLGPAPATITDEVTIRERYRLGGKRILVLPAITHPHKGHRFVLDLLTGRTGIDTAWADADTVLVLLGGPGRADAEVGQAIIDAGLGARIRRPGRVSAADRDGLIAAAEALVFPSQYEGFGAPVLEAMALGTPVICSDETSLPEVAGEAAVVRPLTVDGWEDALDDVVRRRDELVAAGRARAATFSTEASGAALAVAYRRAADDRSGLARRPAAPAPATEPAVTEPEEHHRAQTGRTEPEGPVPAGGAALPEPAEVAPAESEDGVTVSADVDPEGNVPVDPEGAVVDGAAAAHEHAGAGAVADAAASPEPAPVVTETETEIEIETEPETETETETEPETGASGAAPAETADADARRRRSRGPPIVTDPKGASTTGAAELDGGRPLRLVVLCPHFDPDTAPTGRVISRIVAELAARGHQLHVVTALPWYRTHAIEDSWGGRLSRTERTSWGSVRRLHPFPGDDRRNLVRRAAGFAGFSALAGWAGLGAGGWFRRVDAVIAMSPPLTMGVTGRLVAWSHRAPLVFNIQDVFPDAAIETGAITNAKVIAVARWLERVSYRAADAVTVLSDDLRANVVAKLPAARADTVHTIPNFVDTEHIRPGDRDTAYRRELGLGDGPVVLYAGNIGFSQSLDLVLDAARQLPHATFLINGDGAARSELAARAAGIANVRFAGFVADDRLVELLATGDIHVVPLKRGLGAVSVPSKTYSILAAGRPVVAAIDAATEVPRILAASGAGVAVAPDDPAAFTTALAVMLDDLDAARRMGASGRDWVVAAASPAAVGVAYEELVRDLGRRERPRRPGRRTPR